MTEQAETVEQAQLPVQDHRVRIMFKVPGLGPVDAVEGVIEQFVTHGLRTWTYHVENLETGQQYFVDGHGNVELMEDVVDALEDDGEDEDGP